MSRITSPAAPTSAPFTPDVADALLRDAQPPAPRPTAVCVAAPQPAPPAPLRAAPTAAGGTIGGVDGARLQLLGTPTAATRTAVEHARPVGLVVPNAGPGPLSTAAAAAAGAFAAGAPTAGAPPAEPAPQLELRVRAVYAVDQGAAPVWTVDQVRAAVGALVEAANRDLLGTGFRFVFFPRHDVEVRTESLLRRDYLLAPDVVAKMTSGQIGEAEGQELLDAAGLAGMNRRNAVAAERPNAMLWLFSRGNRFDKVRDAAGKFLRWQHVDDRGGSFSGGANTFVALHEAFLTSVAHAHDDASRAAHETGHYLGLWHTHREPFHDVDEMVRQGMLPANFAGRPAAERFSLWRGAVAAWLDGQLPGAATPTQAANTYDVDRGSGVLDTPADPGAGVLALANEAAGNGPNELGPVATVTLDVPGVSGPVPLTPRRDNPMGYYLRETPDPMRFTAGQVQVMRQQLTDGGRRPLVAAQLGDSATPDLRVAAVWSPSAAGQRLTWGQGLAGHQAEHERMRQQGFALVHQQAYTRQGAVLFDGVWDPGARQQEVLWGWLDQHVFADVAQRRARGMLPAHVQGYQHLDHGVRYNVVYEPGSGDARVLLGVTQDQLLQEWNAWMPKGYRMTCLSSHVDGSGVVRHSTVLRPASTAQAWVTGWAGADMAAEYGRQWARGWKLRHLTLVRIADGHRWSGVFEPDARGQLVYWAHVRERIAEVYDEMWASDFKLRAMCVAPA